MRCVGLSYALLHKSSPTVKYHSEMFKHFFFIFLILGLKVFIFDTLLRPVLLTFSMQVSAFSFHAITAVCLRILHV